MGCEVGCVGAVEELAWGLFGGWRLGRGGCGRGGEERMVDVEGWVVGIVEGGWS